MVFAKNSLKSKGPHGYYSPLLNLTDFEGIKAPITYKRSIRFNPKVQLYDSEAKYTTTGPLHFKARPLTLLEKETPQKTKSYSQKNSTYYWATGIVSVIALSALAYLSFQTPTSNGMFDHKDLAQRGYPDIPKHLSLHDITPLENTHFSLSQKYPQLYPGSGLVVEFCQRGFQGLCQSALVKSFLASANQGEFPKPMGPVCNEGWCQYTKIPEKLTSQDKYMDFASFKEFHKGDDTLTDAELQSRYRENLKRYDQTQALKYEQLKTLPQEVRDHFLEKTAQTNDVTRGIHYYNGWSSPEVDQAHTINDKVERNVWQTNQDSPPLCGIRSRNSFQINRRGDLTMTNAHHNNSPGGARKGEWNYWHLVCQSSKESRKVVCDASEIDHYSGKLLYQYEEEPINATHSVIEESIEKMDGAPISSVKYILDHSKQLPAFLTNLIFPDLFHTQKRPTAKAKWGGGLGPDDAKVVIPTDFSKVYGAKRISLRAQAPKMKK